MLLNHTGLICYRSFQNYAFEGWLSLETMKVWLLVLTKPLFLMILNIKLTLVLCAKIAPKLKNIRKYLRKQGFFDIFSSILMVFLSLCLLGQSQRKRKTLSFVKKKNVIFWHPWDPSGWINNGKNFGGVQTATVFSELHN